MLELELLRDEIKKESTRTKEEMLKTEDKKKAFTFYSITMTLIKLSVIIDKVIEQSNQIQKEKKDGRTK